MEPRWRKEWKERYRHTFLGGVPEADLWLDNDGDIRAVSAAGWGFFSKGARTFELRWHKGSPEVHQAVPAIELYLKLFCPEVWAALEIGSKDGA